RDRRRSRSRERALRRRARRQALIPHGSCREAIIAAVTAFSVRRAGADDIPTLARHRAGMFRDMGKLPADKSAALQQAPASYLRDALPRGEYVAWVAEDASTPPVIVGGAGAQLRPILPR